VKFLTLFNALKSILSRLKRKKQSENSSATQQNWKKNELVGICIGHSRRGDKGAENFFKTTSEWDYNNKVAVGLKKELKSIGIESKIYPVYKASGYTGAMGFIKRKLREDGATLALELHFNAYNGKARGCETLYTTNHPESKILATCIQESVLNGFYTVNRGIKQLRRNKRGWLFVNNWTIPAVLCEPFFGDNKHDWLLFSNPKRLAKSYAEGIQNFLVRKTNK